MKTLTRKQLYDGLVNCNSKYVAARHKSGEPLGHNVKVAIHGMKMRGYSPDDVHTNFIGFYPISFAEYIRIKLPCHYID